MVSDVNHAALIGCAIGVAVFVLLSTVLWLFIRSKPKPTPKEAPAKPRQRTDVRRNGRPRTEDRPNFPAMWSVSTTTRTETRTPASAPTPPLPDLGEMLRPLDRAMEDLQRQMGNLGVGTMAHLQETMRQLHTTAAETIRSEAVNLGPGETRVIERNGLRITISNSQGELRVSTEASSTPENPAARIQTRVAKPPAEVPKKPEPKIPDLYERILRDEDEDLASCPTTTSAEQKKSP